MLGILLCYNDGDLLPESITHLLENHHDIVLWDHGSTDETQEVIERFRPHLVEVQRIPREFDFYGLYPAMSHHIIEKYMPVYDWISWPDQDESLEGPDRLQPYWAYIQDVYESPYDWVRFNNFNYWFTAADDPRLALTCNRVRYYAIFPDCAPRIRAWRASSTNERIFNHNPPLGREYPVRFNLRHYPMRSKEQMINRIAHDRAGLQRGQENYHYNYMLEHIDDLYIPASELHYDDRVSELNHAPIFNWRRVYGSPPSPEKTRPQIVKRTQSTLEYLQDKIFRPFRKL